MGKTTLPKFRKRGRRAIPQAVIDTIAAMASEWDENEDCPVYTYEQIANATGVSITSVCTVARGRGSLHKKQTACEKYIPSIISMLNDRDDKGKRRTLREMSAVLKISAERVRQIIKLSGMTIPPLRTKQSSPPIDWDKLARDRFWSNVEKTDGCWEWSGALSSLGYGRFTWKRNKQCKGYAHRASWLINRGPIPEGLCVLHHCDNRKCVNPNHLYVGTMKDNCADRDSRGRNGMKGKVFERKKKLEVTLAYAYWLGHQSESKASCARKYDCGTSSLCTRIIRERKKQNAPPLTEERGKAQSEDRSDSSTDKSSTSSALGGEVREKSEG